MIENCRKITQELKLEAISSTEAEAMLQAAESRVWRDVQVEEGDDLGTKLDDLQITGLARRLCLEARDRAGVYPLKNEIVFVIPVPSSQDDLLNIGHLAFVCKENLLLTLHEDPLPGLKLFEELGGADSWLPARSIAGLVAAMMISLSQVYLQLGSNLRKKIFMLEEQMEREPEEVEVENILDLRSKLVAVGTVVHDHGPPLQTLCKINKPFFELRDTEEFLNCALSNQQAADGALTWLDQRISSLRSGFEFHAHDKTNRRLNTLTVLSAVFNPITLLAGIWGMNFVNMPELKLPYAYPIGLGLMGVIAILIFHYFRKTGWLD